jgi:hypothetical protein
MGVGIEQASVSALNKARLDVLTRTLQSVSLSRQIQDEPVLRVCCSLPL